MSKQESRTARRKQRKTKKRSIFKTLFKYIIILMTAAIAGVILLFTYYIATAPTLDIDKLSDPFVSEFYNKDGEFFADVGGAEKRKKITYDDLPDVLIDAVVATEDARFFSHPGIDIRRIGGAIKANITRGFGAEGASTITQQVVESAFLTPDKTIKLKVQEQWLALKLEREYSKEQIMEMYLNKIFYGNHSYGVAKAAERYFGKTDLHDLTLAEAAILAGLPQRPTAYNPYESPDLTKGRLETVLQLMVRHNKITEAEAEEARNIEIESLLAGSQPAQTKYEAFIQQASEEIREKLSDVDVYTDGLKVYTTLDNDAQQYVEHLLTDSNDNPIPYPDDELQAGMVVVNTQTGEIQAVGGRRNSKGLDELNYARNKRQPGSTAKPILAYGPAIEFNKWSTYEQINDDKPFKVGNHEFRNHNRRYQGWMSARFALAHSLNVPALKTIEAAGFNNAKKFAENLGVHFENDIMIGDAIGGASMEMSALQLAGAYSAFGNEGIYNEPHAVTKIEFQDGTVINLKPEPEAVMADYTAYMITDMLKTVLKEGTGRNANIPSLPVAGKTGTTNIPGKSGANNSWFAGYTTNYTIAVWTGYDEHNRIINNTQIPHALFKNTMTELSKNIETADFSKPDSVVELKIVKGSKPAQIASANTPSANIVTELFVKGNEPTEVSKDFEEMKGVTNLTASYSEESNSIDVSWDYEDMTNISFEVTAAINGGQPKTITDTTDKSVTISEVEEDASYTIQVSAVNSETNEKSPPASVIVKTMIEEEEPEEQTLPPVSSLTAQYSEGNKSINVSWAYNGPDATFEVNINGNTESTSGNSFTIPNISPGSYTITVKPISSNGIQGEARQTTVQVNNSNNDTNDQPNPPPNNNNGNNSPNDVEDEDELNDENE